MCGKLLQGLALGVGLYNDVNVNIYTNRGEPGNPCTACFPTTECYGPRLPGGCGVVVGQVP